MEQEKTNTVVPYTNNKLTQLTPVGESEEEKAIRLAKEKADKEAEEKRIKELEAKAKKEAEDKACLLYTSPSPRDRG